MKYREIIIKMVENIDDDNLLMKIYTFIASWLK